MLGGDVAVHATPSSKPQFVLYCCTCALEKRRKNGCMPVAVVDIVPKNVSATDFCIVLYGVTLLADYRPKVS